MTALLTLQRRVVPTVHMNAGLSDVGAQLTVHYDDVWITV